MTINTPADWWALFDRILPSILECMGRVSEQLREELEPQLIEAAAQRDGPACVQILQELWQEAPDNPVIHTWPHWEQICDLCSEDWVLYE